MAFLSAEQLEHFQQEGYSSSNSSWTLNAISTRYSPNMRGCWIGLPRNCWPAAPSHRCIVICHFPNGSSRSRESGKVHAQYFDFSLPQDGITETTPFWTGPAVFNTIRSPKILDAIESIIGSEISRTRPARAHKTAGASDPY